MRKTAVIHVFLFVVTVALSCHAGDLPKTAEEVLSFSAQKMAGCKSWTANYHQFSDAVVVKTEVTGTMLFKQPDLTRLVGDMLMLDMGMTNKMLLVQGADKVIWQEVTVMGQKQIMKWEMTKFPTNSPLAAAMKSKSANPQDKWKLRRERYDYKLTGTGTINGQPVFILEGAPKKDAPAYVKETEMHKVMGKSRLCIGQPDGFPYKEEQFYVGDVAPFMVIEYANVKFDAALSDDLFKYAPPAGVPVIDVTQQMQKQLAPKLAP
jgi:outer membrane lipoprotein-sorting protein